MCLDFHIGELHSAAVDELEAVGWVPPKERVKQKGVSGDGGGGKGTAGT